MFESITLVAPFSAGDLTEALALYRDVEIIVDDNQELVDVIDWFTPQGLTRFLDDFHESVRINCRYYHFPVPQAANSTSVSSTALFLTPPISTTCAGTSVS